MKSNLSLVSSYSTNDKGSELISRRCFNQSLGVLLLAMASQIALSKQGLVTGDPFPSISSTEVEGTVPDIKGKVVLVDFFASWCAPCKLSLPALQRLYANLASRGFMVLGISVDKKKSDLDKFLRKHLVEFPVVRDLNGKVAATAQIKTMPSSFILDRDGKICAIHEGFHGTETVEQYEAKIKAILK